MAEAVPLDFHEKRRLLHGKGMDRRRAEAGRRLLAEGRLAEALEVLEKSPDAAPVEEVRRAAARAGDVFALQRSAQILRAEVSPDEWREAARRAEADGRYYEAIKAFERAGDAARAEELRLAHHPDFAPIRPAGK